MRAAIYLNESKQNTVQRGHPWVFPKAIERSKGVLKTGELVDIFGAKNELLGVGVYNEHSMYRVRVLALACEMGESATIDSLLRMRLEQALSVRKSLGLPSEQTNAFRMLNSEADGLSGLTIDYFHGVCVISSTAFWVEANKSLISEAVSDIFPCTKVIWQSQAKSLAQDGWSESERPEDNTVAEVLEAGVRYQVQFGHAQKTGLFLDQRENHQRIAALAHGKRVLDLYTYTGGFALHAAKAGAIKVTAVDSSAPAIEQARQNAKLNGLTNIELVEADAREYLARAGDYDVIVLDPPKLVPSRQHLQRAKNYYRFLHREVFKAMQPGSLLLTCNCSSALSQAEFCNLVSSQAMAMQKSVRLLGVYGPSSCHPTLPCFPEGNYLTAALFAMC